MKKVLIIIAALSLIAILFAACNGPDETTSEDTTSSATETTAEDTTDTTEEEVSVTTPDNLIVEENYTATPNEEEWNEEAVDYSQYDYCGSGSTVVNKINRTFNGYQKTYVLKNEDGTTENVSHTEVRKLGTAGIKITSRDDSAKTISLEVRDIAVKVLPEWTAVTAKAGTYLMFDFITNTPTDFIVTVTAEEGGAASTAVYTQDGITTTADNGKYVGVAKCTVPYQEGKTYYINICLDTTGTPAVVSIPVEITKAKYDSEFSLIFQGDWELVRSEDYLPDLVDLFYNSYPRLYARFALGNAPKQITFMADKNYEGVAYCAGTVVCVSVDYANAEPLDLGFFSHEITHSVQQYEMLNYGEGSSYEGKTLSAWWTESMATYGGFRYFHWGYSTKFVQIYDVNNDSTLRNFEYEGDGCKWFFAYLDYMFPTMDENGDGEISVDEYGVVDLINYTIKTSEVEFTDNPWDPSTPFNKAVYTATDGKYGCIDEINKQFTKDCEDFTFVFKGFRDYKDNFITEDLDGIPNPSYPMLEPVAKGDITNPILSSPVTEGTNLLIGAEFVEYSSRGVAKNVISNLIDGDVSTKWQASVSKTDNKYLLGSYDHDVVIDLGQETTFNTYTLYNASSSERESFNMAEWEIFVSNDGVNFTSVDYQSNVNQAVVSVNIGNQTARYIMLRVHRADQNGTGTVRLYEFMLFDQE